jgi:hypothetical protein
MATGLASITDPDLGEMLKILDAASAMRRERELVAEQLSADEYHARLRERLLEAAKATGDPVKPEEVDAAIRLYFERLHAYSDPPMSLAVVLAHAYVRRGAILAWTVGILAAGFCFWALFLNPGSPFGIVGARERGVARAWGRVEKELAVARANAADSTASARLEGLAVRAEALRAQGDAAKLDAVADEAESIAKELESEYVIEVVHGPGEKSAVDRYYTDEAGKRISGYYLIVEARDPRGRPVKVSIRNGEVDNRTDLVSRWAERVPLEVYERLRADKQSDGRLDEYVFGSKKRGVLSVEVEMRGPDGVPLRRLGQITEW